VVTVLLTAGGFAAGPRAQTAPASAPTAPPQPSTAPKVIPGLEQGAQKLPPLLREGTFLSRASGTVREDPKRNEWIFTPDKGDRSGHKREFILLPNEPLGEAVRVARLAPGPIGFDVSGEIFMYRGRNYLLASLLTPFVPSPSAIEAPAPGPAQPAQPDQAKSSGSKPEPARVPDGAVDEEAIANELERRLAERIDRMPKAPVAPPTATASASNEKAAFPATAEAAPMRSDTLIQSRRGQLVRDNATGGWRFVFDGQLPEGGEPSMAVLPCLALERIEDAVRRTDVSLSLVVTGTTTAFEGRTYLLPTIFRMARGGKGINP
jgi:hypothetical protein